MLNQAKTILKEVFGFDRFLPLQEEVILSVLDGKDTLVVMPTGSGKSLCYQLPALIFEGLTVVVSPLISLMKDQVEQLVEFDVPAVLLNSSLSWTEYQQNVRRVQQRQAKLLYLAPETLLKPETLSLLSTVPVDCLTIDEAHCISEWGHDFRPEYRQIAKVRNKFPEAVCLALTATATTRVQDDIARNLNFRLPDSGGQPVSSEKNHRPAAKFIGSFNRENLFLQVVPKTDAYRQTLEFLQKFPDQSGIIYCFSRKQTEALAEGLEAQGFSVKPYHAGLPDEVRKQNQELFIRDDVQIIVATIAFGMGINKPNVRFVLHYDLPKSIESYYQEIGRAGRDGLRADCLLLFGYGDTQKIKYFINQKEDELQRQVALQHLEKLVDFAEAGECRRKPLLAYFGESYSQENCGMCDNCLRTEESLTDLTIPAQKFLSCVYRTGQYFGGVHITDVLRGSESQKIFQHGHQHLSTYGIGKEYSKKQWAHLTRQLVRQGLLRKEPEFGSLKLTEKAREVLSGKEKFFGTLQEEPPKAAARTDTYRDYDKTLFDLLRAKRKELADQANVPPYVIFSDKSLVEMAVFYPQSRDTFVTMHGVGAAKLEKYGDIFLDIIRRYCGEHRISERSKHSGKSGMTAKLRALSKPRHVEVGETYNRGSSVSDLATKYRVKQSTILDHLYRFYREGNPLKNGSVLSLSSLSQNQQTEVLEVFSRLGTEMLRPVFDELDGAVSFNELKILRLYYISLQAEK